jgi:non-specific serine/threonine protein kinase
VAAELLEIYPDGVWFVELAPLALPELVPQTVASAVGVREEPGKPILNTLISVLGSKQVLLLLDNCEHLIESCARLADTLIRSCPNVHILATSRTVLGIAGEATWRVPPLSVVDPRHLPSIDSLCQYEAVRLFIDRAVATQPQFEITNQNAPAVAQICHRLDGIPLAIELAAARVRSLTPEQISGRLDQRFRMLIGGSRTALPRQQTLRAMVDWSYDLLSDHEQALFRRLSVFAGGWTLEAAESVCAMDPIDTADVMDLLSALVDKSLVLADEQRGNIRYRLLETLRQYGTEKLAETDESTTMLHRHAVYFTKIATILAAQCRGPEQLAAFDRLEQEHDNLRAILSRVDEPDYAALGLEVAATLTFFWYHRNYWNECKTWLDRWLQRTDLSGTSVWVIALSWNGLLTTIFGEAEAGSAMLVKAASQARELQDAVALSQALSSTAGVCMHRGDGVGMEQAAAEALPACVASGYEYGTALHHQWLGCALIMQGKPVEAVQHLAVALELARKVGDRFLVAMDLNFLGQAAAAQGDFQRATDRLIEAVELFREHGNRGPLSLGLKMSGQVALRAGDLSTATAQFSDGLAIASEIRKWPDIAGDLSGLACVASSRGFAEQAAQLLAAAGGVRQRIMAKPTALECDLEEQAMAAIQSQLADDAFRRAWLGGQQMPLDQAVALADTVALMESPPAGPTR